MKKIILSVFALCSLFFMASCENGDKEYDDFTYQTVYFAQQNPVRTITIGEDDVFPNDLDNLHQCQIQVVLGGVWENRANRHVKVAVDNSLVDGLTFGQINGEDFANTGKPVLAMPADYYSLSTNDVIIPKGEVRGKINVQLTDAFFADPRSSQVTYVIPVRIVEAEDSILKNMDYTLYAVTYKNTWGGSWINTADGSVLTLSTLALNKISYPHSTTVKAGGVAQTLNCNVIMTVADDGSIAFSTDTPGSTVTGSGRYTALGAKKDPSKKWGDEDRDLLELNYDITYTYDDGGTARTLTENHSESLVMQTRGNLLQTFTTK